MLDLPAPLLGKADTGFLAPEEAKSAAAPGGALHTLLRWLSTYPISSHAELGRPGVVCPFTRPAQKNGAIRVGVETCGELDEAHVVKLIRRGLDALKDIPARRGDEHFRTVVIAFPNCGSETGIAMLERAIKRYKYYCLLHLRTMGLLHPASQQPGLWNSDFRPMTAPLPVLVIRYVVEQDARFIAHHHLQWGPYLLRYGRAGARRLAAERRDA